MFFETITYKDFNGLERKENFYFHFSEDELVEMELSNAGGFAEFLRTIIAAKDQEILIKEFKKFILKAYGEKSADGRRFIKSDEISKAFSETPAFTKLYMKLAFNADAASKFINALIPAEFSENIKKYIEAGTNAKTELEAADASFALEAPKPIN